MLTEHGRPSHVPPIKATGLLSGDEKLENRPVRPAEIFFDLFFAASLAKLGEVLIEELSEHPAQLIYATLIFDLVFETWLQVGSARPHPHLPLRAKDL